MDEKEILMNYIENMDLAKLVPFLTNFEKTIDRWKSYKQNKKALQSIDGEENELAKIIANIFAEPQKSEKEEKMMEMDYKAASRFYEFLKSDEDVIEALSDKIYYINYDEESEEKRAEAIYCLASLLRSRLATENDKNSEWRPVQESIAGVLKEMTTRDLLTTFELTSRRSFSENELYNDIMAQKIPGMTEPEFFRCLSLSNDGMGILYPNSKLATLNRIRSGNEKLAPLYIYYCKDSEEALNLVERVEKSGYDTLEIMIKLETVSRGSKVSKKVEELAQKLSTDRILTFLINRSNIIAFNNVIEETVLKRLGELSKAQIELLLSAYMHSPKQEVKDKIVQVAIQKGALIRKGDKFYTEKDIFSDEMQTKINIYRKKESIISNLPTPSCGRNPLDMPQTIQENDVLLGEDEVKEKMAEACRLDDLEISSKEKLINYVLELETVSDIDILRILPESSKAIVQEVKVDGENLEETKKAMILKEISKYLKSYLENRILNMKDARAVVLLSNIYSKCGVFKPAIETRLEQLQYLNLGENPNGDENPGSDGR